VRHAVNLCVSFLPVFYGLFKTPFRLLMLSVVSQFCSSVFFLLPPDIYVLFDAIFKVMTFFDIEYLGNDTR